MCLLCPESRDIVTMTGCPKMPGHWLYEWKRCHISYGNRAIHLNCGGISNGGCIKKLYFECYSERILKYNSIWQRRRQYHNDNVFMPPCIIFVCISYGSPTGCSCTMHQARVPWDWKDTRAEKRLIRPLMRSISLSIWQILTAWDVLASTVASRPLRSFSALQKCRHSCFVLIVVSDISILMVYFTVLVHFYSTELSSLSSSIHL